MNNFNTYAQECKKTAFYPGANTGNMEELSYLALGLAGESGEFVDIIKKLVRDKVAHASDIEVEKYINLRREMGDIFWYLGQLARTLDFDVYEVLKENQEKLAKRADTVWAGHFKPEPEEPSKRIIRWGRYEAEIVESTDYDASLDKLQFGICIGQKVVSINTIEDTLHGTLNHLQRIEEANGLVEVLEIVGKQNTADLAKVLFTWDPGQRILVNIGYIPSNKGIET